MATKEEYEAAAERIKLGLVWDEERQLFWCGPAMAEAMAEGAVDAAEQARRRKCHPVSLAPARRDDYHEHDHEWTHPLVREDRPE